MTSIYMDPHVIRQSARWYPRTLPAYEKTEPHGYGRYYAVNNPSSMGVLGQRTYMTTRETMTPPKVISQHSTNSWVRTAFAPQPPPTRRRLTETNKSRPRTAVQATNSEKSIPIRPTLRRQCQVTGRFFPKPSLTDEDRILLSLQTGRPLSGSFLMSNKYHEIKKMADIVNNSAASNIENKRPKSSCNLKIAATRRVLFDHSENVAKSEVFMISFRDEDKKAYDPSSELHSDYYTVKRQVHFAPIRQVSVPELKETNFTDLVRGRSKRMHARG